MKNKISSSIIIIAVAALIFSLATNFFSAELNTQLSTPQKAETSTNPITTNKVVLKVPAVDDDGNGIATTLIVQSMSGEGRVLTNINQLLFWVDTQHSIQTAKSVAEKITKVDTSRIDLIYTIDTNASVIEGQSAGAALAVATVTVLSNRTLNPEVMITGTINEDGTIGPVGAVTAKAQAAKEAGAKLFLVPEGQSIRVTYVPKRTCEKIGQINYCTTEYVPKPTEPVSEAGIKVQEVSTINEALKYFTT